MRSSLSPGATATMRRPASRSALVCLVLCAAGVLNRLPEANASSSSSDTSTQSPTSTPTSVSTPIPIPVSTPIPIPVSTSAPISTPAPTSAHTPTSVFAPNSTSSSSNGGCEKYDEFFADGFCDDFHNNGPCEYDGGDCCYCDCVPASACVEGGFDCKDPSSDCVNKSTEDLWEKKHDEGDDDGDAEGSLAIGEIAGIVVAAYAVVGLLIVAVLAACHHLQCCKDLRGWSGDRTMDCCESTGGMLGKARDVLCFCDKRSRETQGQGQAPAQAQI